MKNISENDWNKIKESILNYKMIDLKNDYRTIDGIKKQIENTEIGNRIYYIVERDDLTSQEDKKISFMSAEVIEDA